MRLIGLAVVLAATLVLAPLAAEAQPGAGVPRVGILFPSPLSATSHLLEAFRQGLRELGYVEGQNIALEFRSAEGREERLPDLAAELVRLKVAVILTGTGPGIRAAKRATQTIPVVMGNGGDPVAGGFVVSLARPGGNITGLTNMYAELIGKRLELLKEVVPKTSRVAVLLNADNAPAVLFRDQEVAARTLGIRFQILEVRGPTPDLVNAFQAATREGAGALIVLDDPLTFSHRTQIVRHAAESRLPASYGFREFVEAGGLMAYGASIPHMYRRAATYVDKILKGAKPGDLPIEQPTKFELVVNLKTAKALGLTIPHSLLLRADQVLQ
jgi:putative tryptophan/tyrosine transport system substrate-binding protein